MLLAKQSVTKKLAEKFWIKTMLLEENKRIYSLHLDSNKVNSFFEKTNHITTRELEYIPYYRFLLSQELNNIFNNELDKLFLKILNDYGTGAFTISINEIEKRKENYLKFSTAISHLVGLLNIDLLSGKFYTTFTIDHNENASVNILRPYDNFKMHTDGAFMKEPTDWVLFMKMCEENVLGGETRLLHMEDWHEFNFFYEHRLGVRKFKFAGPSFKDKRSQAWGNHRATDSLMSAILKIHNKRKSIRFVDQFLHPNDMEEADYIAQIQNSLEESKNITKFELRVGSILVINNHVWVHGRNKFDLNKKLKRELMRQRGSFANELQ